MPDEFAGLSALICDDDGPSILSDKGEDWREWVSATDLRNYLLDDPLIDWLEHFGKGQGFSRDDECPHYDPRTDFQTFLYHKATAFENAVVSALKTRFPVTTVAQGGEDAHHLSRVKDTVRAIEAGAPIISQAVLLDPTSRTHGIADLVVRSDTLLTLPPLPDGGELERGRF